MAANCANDLHRSPWRGKMVPLEEVAELPGPPEPPAPDSVLAAVTALPETYRAVVHLYYYEDLSAEEIAKTLGIRVGAVNTRLSRARSLLRDALKEAENYVESGI